MGNPYDVLRDRVQAAAVEYYACTMEHPGIVLVQMTPQQCHEVVTGMGFALDFAGLSLAVEDT